MEPERTSEDRRGRNVQTTTHQPHAYGSHPVAPLQYVTPTQLVVLTQPTVVVQAPAVQVHPGGRPWTTGLCGCTEDCCLCLLGCCCPCCLVNQIVDRLEENCCYGASAMGAMRTKLRLIIGIRGSMCNDGIVVCCCPSCALCQMVREMNNQGVPRKGCCSCTFFDCCTGCQM